MTIKGRLWSWNNLKHSFSTYFYMQDSSNNNKNTPSPMCGLPFLWFKYWIFLRLKLRTLSHLSTVMFRGRPCIYEMYQLRMHIWGYPQRMRQRLKENLFFLSFGVQTAAAKCLFSVTQSFNSVLADYLRARKSDFTLRLLF